MGKILLSTAYHPPISFMMQFLSGKAIHIEHAENFQKQSYRNRCLIFSANGPLALSVPVIRTNGNHTRITDILIDNSKPWQKIHWRAIESAYNGSPFFLYYRDEIEPFYTRQEYSLAEMNASILATLLKCLRLDPLIQYTTEYQKAGLRVIDLRKAIHPKKPSVVSHFPAYIQVFSNRHGFLPDLSILDLLFNLGPEVATYLRSILNS